MTALRPQIVRECASDDPAKREYTDLHRAWQGSSKGLPLLIFALREAFRKASVGPLREKFVPEIPRRRDHNLITLFADDDVFYAFWKLHLFWNPHRLIAIGFEEGSRAQDFGWCVHRRELWDFKGYVNGICQPLGAPTPLALPRHPHRLATQT